MYYKLIYDANRSIIIKDGEIAARKSADQFERYLSTNTDLINFTAYTLNDMITDKVSDKNIQSFLVVQSTTYRNAVVENSTGLYGYINGRFFSGTNWVPPADFVATERPWYTKPISNGQEISITEPYVDAQDGGTMLALGKTLCDNVSVISVDLSLDQVQRMTEEAVENEGIDVEMILNDQGMVVTHSDRNELGKDYSEEADSFGAEIFKQLEQSEENSFEFDYNGSHYIVYAAEFLDNWYCISVKDATSVFDWLLTILIITIITTIIVVVIVSLLMLSAHRRTTTTEHALAASEAKSAFLSNMSHEIRTPINAILGMNEMILRESNENNVLSYAGNVKTAGQTLLGIVNDILDFSRIESGKLTIVPVEYDLSVVLNDLVNMVKTRAEEKGLTLYTDFDENIPKHLYGDEIRIKQAITNILTNAVKYTEKGSVTFRVSFNRVTDEPDQILLYISVKDSGIGIKEEDLQKIFSEFERLELQRNRSIEGTGLGMNITKHILDLMGSTLQVESIYGFGSTFSFSLKQKVMNWDPMGDYRISVEKPAEEQTRYRAKFSAPDAHVLVVDDNPMNLMVFKSLLSKTKLKIDTAGSGEEALRLTANAPYDMIFLDHMMPDKDGIETLHEIKQQADNPNRNTPYVCLTANAISGAREQYLAEGFDDYLSKPINPEKLEEMLIKHLPEDKLEEADAEEELQPEEEFPEELAPIRDFPLIDIDEGIKNSGSVTAYLSLLKIFFNSIDDTSLALEKYNADEDYHNFTIRIHALKSSARIIGATELGEDAQLLENAGKSGDTDYIHSHFGSFLEKYRSLRDPLEKAFPETEPGDKPEASGEDIKRCLEEIKAAANDMDCDRLEKIFEEMSSWRIPDEYAKLWNKLKEASDQFDYDKILELLKE